MAGAGPRSRWPRWPVTLAVVGAVVAGGAAAVAKWPHAWWWLIVVMVAAGRRLRLRLAASWPWALQIAAAIARLQALTPG